MLQRLMSKSQKRKHHYLQMPINEPPIIQQSKKRLMKMNFKNISKWNRINRSKERTYSLQEFLIFHRLTNIQTNFCIRSKQVEHREIDLQVNSLCHHKEISANSEKINKSKVKLSFFKGRINCNKSVSKKIKF